MTFLYTSCTSKLLFIHDLSVVCLNTLQRRLLFIDIKIDWSCIIEDEIVLAMTFCGNVDIRAIVNVHNVIYDVHVLSVAVALDSCKI
jgi:hypothetical protein